MNRATNRNGPGVSAPGPVIVADDADIETFCSSDIDVKAAETQAGNDAGTDFLRAVRSSSEECDMTELLERLGTANAGSRELDSIIWRDTGIERKEWFLTSTTGQPSRSDPYAYTTSVDGAMLLIPPDWHIYGIRDHRWLSDGSGYAVQLRRIDTNAVATGHADTLPIAICIASLRAKSGEGA